MRRKKTITYREELKSKATEVAEKAKQRGKEELEAGKNKAADQVQDVAGIIEQVSEGLAGQEQQSLAGYASEVADKIREFSDHLRGRSIEDLIADAQSVARRNPGLFLVGSVGLGYERARETVKKAAEEMQQAVSEQIER
jgi:hypothetical protein